MEITLKGWRCNQCGWTWYSRGKNKPLYCAGCKKASWDRPAVKKEKKS